MATHKRVRRNIRRLTRRKIPLPVVGAQRAAESSPLDSSPGETPAVKDESPVDVPAVDAAAAQSESVASSLAELRLPGDDGETNDATAEASAPSESADEAAIDATNIEAAEALPPPAASELSEDEPATNPQIRLAEHLRLASVTKAKPPTVSVSSEASKPLAVANAAESTATAEPQPTAAVSSAAPAEGAAASDAENPESQTQPFTPVETLDVEVEVEPATGEIRKPDAPAAESQRAPRRPDSDAPTRPRIELSSEMAFAAGRVTSLELSPIRSEAPRRGSKVPPASEPRTISSLTGRRSNIPVSSDAEDEASRPSVVVTRSKIISDRPPKPALEATRTAIDNSPAIESDVAKPIPADAPKLGELVEAATAPGVIASPAEAAADSPAVNPATPITARPSRRPGSVEGDEFETLDIEDGEVEAQSMRSGPDIDADFEEDPTVSKAPPPPPRRAGAPPAPAVPAPPKAAPPPPPRVPAAMPAAAASASIVTSLPSPAPTIPGNAVAAAGITASAVASPSFSGGGGAPPPSRKAASSRPQPRRRQWWETLFSDEYLRTVVRPTPQQIARQVDFMQGSLGVTKGTAVLDVGCGLGQHALEFARRGCLVVALDLALPMITRAAEDAQQEGLRINFLHKDIRDIGFEGTFDAVVCVGTTFGFFDDEQNREVLGRLANALKPGGRLLLEVVNRDHVLSSQPNLVWFEGDGCVVMEESDFNYYSSRLSVKRTMMREDGRQTESEYSIRLYALHELGQMMSQVGFRVKEVSGAQATRGVFFGAQSSRIILLAERRTPGPTRGNGHSTSDVPVPNES
jgi:SAM-dependent methyltransferase